MPLKKFGIRLNSKISPFKKEIKVDSDKSISIRSFLIGSISQDISVVKNFENLSILELKNNNVTDISCLKNKKLYFLNLLNNNVFDIDVLSGMGTLRKLNIKDNPIQNYTALKTLNLYRLQV